MRRFYWAWALVPALMVLGWAGIAFSPAAGASTHPCGDSPSSCGFPDGSNTGYSVDGVTLAQMQIHHGPWYITSDNKTISKIDTDGPIIISGSHDTVTDVRVTMDDPSQPAIQLVSGASSPTIKDSVIRGTDTTSTGAMELAVKDMLGTPVTGILIDKVNVYNTGGGFQFYDGTVSNSYVHIMTDGGSQGWHVEAYNSTGNCGDCNPPYGPHPVYITHNTFLNQVGQTAAIYEGADFSASQNIHADHNLLAGGGYTVYGGGLGVGSQANPKDITFTNNVFSTLYYPRTGCSGSYGCFGPDAYYSTSAPGDAWTNNTDDGTGALVGP